MWSSRAWTVVSDISKRASRWSRQNFARSAVNSSGAFQRSNGRISRSVRRRATISSRPDDLRSEPQKLPLTKRRRLRAEYSTRVFLYSTLKIRGGTRSSAAKTFWRAALIRAAPLPGNQARLNAMYIWQSQKCPSPSNLGLLVPGRILSCSGRHCVITAVRNPGKSPRLSDSRESEPRKRARLEGTESTPADR